MISKAELSFQLKLATNKPSINNDSLSLKNKFTFFFFVTKRDPQQYFYKENFSRNKVSSKRIVCVKNSYYNIYTRSNPNKNKIYNSCLDLFWNFKEYNFFFTFHGTKIMFMHSSCLCLENLMYNCGILNNSWIILN